MCIKCHSDNIRYLLGLLTTGPNAPFHYTADHLSEEQVTTLARGCVNLGQHIIDVLTLTMANLESEGSIAFSVDETNLEQVAHLFSGFNNEQLWTIMHLFGSWRRQIDMSEDVVIDMMRIRAKTGDLEAYAFLGGLEVTEPLPGMTVVSINPNVTTLAAQVEPPNAPKSPKLPDVPSGIRLN